MIEKLKQFGITKLTPAKVKIIPGIYFLFNLNELVYIGKAADVYSRIAIHKKNGLTFSRSFYYTVKDQRERDLLEIKLIWEFRPKYNLLVINPKTYLKNKNKPISNNNDVLYKPELIEHQEEPEQNIRYKKIRREKFDFGPILNKSLHAQKILETFPERAQMVIVHRHGLFGNNKKGLEEIGLMWNITRERVRQIQKDTESKLRHPSRFNILKAGVLKESA